MANTLRHALSHLPKGLLDPLLSEYAASLEAARTRKWETVGLKAGKLCEIIYTILRGYVDSIFASKPSKPANMYDACKAFELEDKKHFSRSIRIQMPRLLVAVYELRNNRDIGHVGGDVDPNEMDGIFFLHSVKWLIAELVRLFHNLPTVEAQKLVERVSERTIPQVWTEGEKIRVLNPQLSMQDKTLLILYQAGEPINVDRLFKLVEHSNRSVFLKSVVGQLHKKKFVEFDDQRHDVTILPPGVDEVERRILIDAT